MIKKIKIDDRLSTIVYFVEKSHIVADIGTDHGLVPNYLVEEGIASLVYATDVSKESLKKNEEFTKTRNNEGKVISLVGDGLEPIKDKKVNTLILAGMGGDLIINILKMDIDYLKDKSLIIQPQTSTAKVRSFLGENGFDLIDEKIVEERDKYYHIIYSKYSGNINLEIDQFPENLLSKKDPVLNSYIEDLIGKNDKLANDLKNVTSSRAQDQRQKLLEENKNLKEVLNTYES